MKSIHEMWIEYLKNITTSLTNFSSTEKACMRRAFYAGFNRCYNAMNEVTQWESEMDNASEGKFKETV